MVSAWPEPPSDTSAAKSVGVRDGMEALAFAGTETPPLIIKLRAFDVGRRSFYFALSNSGSFAMFAAMRLASSSVSPVSFVFPQ